MSRFARNVDANQGQVVSSLRAAGAWVWSTANVGNGFPDLLVWFGDRFHLLEVKDGAKPPSARKLTPAELRFNRSCPGPVHVVHGPEQALEAIGAIRRSA